MFVEGLRYDYELSSSIVDKYKWLQQDIPLLQYLLQSGLDIEYANEWGLTYFSNDRFNDAFLMPYGEHGVEIPEQLPKWVVNAEYIKSYEDFQKIRSLKFPIFKLSKSEMYQISKTHGFNKLLHYTWTC
jgi:hypothetical protein